MSTQTQIPCVRGTNEFQGIAHHWCTTHNAEWLLSTVCCEACPCAPDVGNFDSPLGGVKHDDEKLRVDLIPVRPLEDIAQVLTYGARKYSDRNWESGFKYGRLFGALLRHLYAWWRGENDDPETGYSHLAHAACCLLFLMEFKHSRRGEDDRPAFDR